MKTNAVPHYDDSVNTTGCCPRFNPDGWDGQELHFKDKPFIRANTRSLAHIPLNMGKVFSRVQTAMTDEGAFDNNAMIVLSHDNSAWEAEHLFATTKPIAGEEMVTLSGDFITKVFEGPYRNMGIWQAEAEADVRARGKEPGKLWFFYTTCPKCAKAYGKNYVVTLTQV